MRTCVRDLAGPCVYRSGPVTQARKPARRRGDEEGGRPHHPPRGARADGPDRVPARSPWSTPSSWKPIRTVLWDPVTDRLAQSTTGPRPRASTCRTSNRERQASRLRQSVEAAFFTFTSSRAGDVAAGSGAARPPAPHSTGSRLSALCDRQRPLHRGHRSAPDRTIGRTFAAHSWLRVPL